MSKPAGIFKQADSSEPVPSGPVQRPTQQMIRKWNESPQVAQTKQAMNDTFANDPELQRLKIMREEYLASLQK